MFHQCCPKQTDPGVGCAAGISFKVQVSSDVYDSFVTVLPLDEIGPHYTDRTRFHHNGTGVNTLQDDGVFCLASTLFNGNSWISVGDDNIRQDTSFSCTVWAKVNSWYKNKAFFSRGSFRFGITFLNQLTAEIDVYTSQNSTATYKVIGTTKLNQGQWYHTAAVFDREQGKMRIYVNGVLDGTTTVGGVDTLPLTESYLGEFENGQRLEGNLQEFRLAPQVLSADWIAAEYQTVCGNLYTIGSPFDSIFG